MSNGLCPICQLPTITPGIFKGGDWEPVHCPNCGRFKLSGSVEAMISQNSPMRRRERAVLSYAIHRMQSGESWPLITHDIVRGIVARDDLPTPTEQVDLLLVLLAESDTPPGERCELLIQAVRAAIGAVSDENVIWAMQSLRTEGLAEMDGVLGPRQALTLTLAGWKRYQSVKSGERLAMRAFMAMQFGDAELDLVFLETLRPAVHSTGFTLVRLNEAPPAGLIDVRLRAELRRSRFLLADLTHRNPGAYWEAGFMEGLGRPVIYLCKEAIFQEHKTHFDTNHSHHVLWDPADLDRCARELAATIRATLPGEARMED